MADEAKEKTMSSLSTAYRLGRAVRRFFVTEPENQDRHVGHAKSSADCFWCDRTISPGEMVLYYGEPPAQVARMQKAVIFHYSCAMTLDLERDHSSSLTLYANLKQRLEAQEKIKELLLKNSPEPNLEAKMNNLPATNDGNVPMIETAELIILLQLLQKLASDADGEGNTRGITKFITQLENTSIPLAEFMAPVLEKESRNPLFLGDILVALSEEGNHDSRVIEMVKGVLDGTLKRLGWSYRIPVTTIMAKLVAMNDPVVLSTIKAALERALGNNYSPVIAALNAELKRQSRS